MSQLRLAAISLGVLSILSLGGCSKQWNEASPGHTPEEVTSMLDEVQGAQGQSVGGGDVSSALQLRDTGTIYFADSDSNLGKVPSVLGFNDFSFLGSDAAQFSWDNITSGRVFFIDRAGAGGSEDIGLIVGINQGSGYKYYGFNGQGSVSKSEFSATLTGGGGSIVVRSYDVVDGALADVIQIRVYQVDPNNGDEVFIGQFSTLVAY